MASDNETVADIVREMRNDKGVDNAGWFEGKHMRWFADRIEAANKREVAELKRRMRVLEDVLIPILNCDTDGIVLNFEETQIVNGHDIAIATVDVVDKAKIAYREIQIEAAVRNALDVIREEGGAK